MRQSNLEKVFKERYLDFSSRARITIKEDTCLIEIDFVNPGYYVWIKEDRGYMVGINFLHNHYDLKDDETNLNDALEEFDLIINDEIAAIVRKEKESDELIATMGIDEALMSYMKEDPKYEIVTFSKEH